MSETLDVAATLSIVATRHVVPSSSGRPPYDVAEKIFPTGVTGTVNLDGSSTPPVTKSWTKDLVLSGGTLTLDLTALDSGEQDDIDLTGLKVQIVKIIADPANAAQVVIKPGTSNPYKLFDGAEDTYDVEFDANGTPDTFKWRKNGGSYTTGVACSLTAVTLSDGVKVAFGATTGNTVGDKFTITAPAQKCILNSGETAVYFRSESLADVGPSAKSIIITSTNATAALKMHIIAG